MLEASYYNDMIRAVEGRSKREMAFIKGSHICFIYATFVANYTQVEHFTPIKY